MIYKYYDKFCILFRTLYLKLLYQKHGLIIKGKLICMGIPKLTILKNGKIVLGKNVIIGRNVELRAYEGALLMIDSNCKIDDGVRIIAAKKAKVHLKNASKIGYYSVINGGGNIDFGPNSSTYGFVYIQSSSHVVSKTGGFSKTDYSHIPISIGESVLIGPHSVLNPGSKVYDNETLPAHTILNN